MVPFYTTSDYNPSDLSILTDGPGTSTAFGDLAFGLKGLLYQTERVAMSAGLRVESPTNDEVVQPGPTRVFYSSLNDDVWNFTPYVAALAAPSDRLFLQSFISYRLNTGDIETSTGNFGVATTIREQTLFMADLSVGYWVYHNRCKRGLTGLIPTVELHYTGAFDQESSFTGGAQSNTETNRLIGSSDVLNLTAGLTALFNEPHQ